MNPDVKTVLASYLLALADDELVLGHRDSEWCGHAPILEEDIAFANIALDEIGHAIIWYGVYSDLIGNDRDTYPDQLVYFREPRDYRCAPLVALPTGDWAFTMLRQYLFDVAEKIRLEGLANSHYQSLAEAAGKMRAEEIYHLRHTSAWVRRLGLGTEKSNRRMQAALDQLWSYVLHALSPLPQEDRLVQEGYVPDAQSLLASWFEVVVPFLRDSGLKVPQEAASIPYSREQHSDDLAALLSDLQSVARLQPGAGW